MNVIDINNNIIIFLISTFTIYNKMRCTISIHKYIICMMISIRLSDNIIKVIVSCILLC